MNLDKIETDTYKRVTIFKHFNYGCDVFMMEHLVSPNGITFHKAYATDHEFIRIDVSDTVKFHCKSSKSTHKDYITYSFLGMLWVIDFTHDEVSESSNQRLYKHYVISRAEDKMKSCHTVLLSDPPLNIDDYVYNTNRFTYKKFLKENPSLTLYTRKEGYKLKFNSFSAPVYIKDNVVLKNLHM